MFDYNTLSFTRKHFVDLAIQEFPDITNQITRDQINHIITKHNIGFPQWLTISTNKQGKSLWGFPTKTDTTGAPVKEIPQESDEEIAVRIRDTYAAMDDMVRAVSANAVNSLVVAGGPGLGKSFGVNKTLSELFGGNYGYIFHRGYIRATHLFRLLWENRHKGQVIVLDDVDIWDDIQTLNLLKAALELKETRRIGWGSEKEFTDEDGEVIPRYFDYEGSIIFLTNEKIHEMIDAKNKYSPHLSAIESRSLVMDMNISSKREYRVALNIKVYEEGMLKNQGFSDSEIAEIMEFFHTNFDKFREVSLRMIEKIARIYRAVPDWQKSARTFCFKK